MPTKVKIRIKDDTQLRAKIDAVYDETDQIILARWSLAMAKHILKLVEISYKKQPDHYGDGFGTNELWQNGKARMYDVRQAGFKIHQLARASDNEVEKNGI